MELVNTFMSVLSKELMNRVKITVAAGGGWKGDGVLTLFIFLSHQHISLQVTTA